MADPQAHADAAYENPYGKAYLDKARDHGRLSFRIDSLADRVSRLEEPMLYSNRQRLQALEKEVAELKEQLKVTYPPENSLATPSWREFITSFDPQTNQEWSWEEVLVAMGTLYGSWMVNDTLEVKQSLARIVSICEYERGAKFINPQGPKEVNRFTYTPLTLYTHFHPEGTEVEANVSPWEWEGMGLVAACWLRSLYA